MDTEFGSSPPFSIGTEEELFLVDPVTGRQANSSAAVIRRLPAGDGGGHVEPELHACQVELISGICTTVGQAVGQLQALRRRVLKTGVGLIGSGTHPEATEGETEVTDNARYERIVELLGDAAATPVAGLHVHVGMPDAETAIRAFNGLRRHLPLLQAVAANSPFRHGRDTGLACAREVTIRGWPRSGVPRAMRDFDDFAATAELLSRAADGADYTWFWWKLRPHPQLGTVEVRALDVQIDPASTAANGALVHCLAATRPRSPEPQTRPPSWWTRGCSARRGSGSRPGCPIIRDGSGRSQGSCARRSRSPAATPTSSAAASSSTPCPS